MKPMLRWVGITALFAIVLAVALRPRGAPLIERDTNPDLTRARVAWQTANADVAWLRDLASRVKAYELARALPPARGGAVVSRHVAPISPAAAARVERILHAELATLAPQGPRHPIALIVIADSAAMGGNYKRHVVLPERDDQPCVIVFGTSPQNLRYPGTPATDRLLGTCGFYAAFGMPSKTMERWILETRLATAAYSMRPAALDEAREAVDPSYAVTRGQLPIASCAAGRAAGCLILLDPKPMSFDETNYFWRRPSREVFDASRSLHPYAESFDAGTGYQLRQWTQLGLLAELSIAMGPERFALLWRDERPIAEAYEALEGRPIAEWIRTHVATRVEPYQPGPGLPALPWTLALVVVSGSGWLGIRYARRVMS